MKVLIVGEGKHEFGSTGITEGPRPAAGFLLIIVRKLCPEIASESVQFSWANLNLVMKKEPRKKFDSKQGLAKKVQYAITQARRYECRGTVCVHDRDGDDDRLGRNGEKGRQAELDKKIGRASCDLGIGVVESIEAWLLGAPTALAAVLQTDWPAIQKHAPEYTPSRVEELKETSEDATKQPKKMLHKIAGLKHRTANTVFREEAASLIDGTSLDELKKNCPLGFKPFAEKLQAAFGPRPVS